MEILAAAHSAVAQGVLWAIMTIGVYLTFRVLDYPDLTVDGSFGLGGAVSARLIVGVQVPILGFIALNPYFTLLFALLAGMAAGAVTGLLHTKLKIPGILAGILSMIALYSVNIRVMGDKSNLPLLGENTIVSLLGDLPLERVGINMLIGAVFCAVIIALLYWFFGTEIGSAIRATGNNEFMSRALGVNTDWMKITGLTISNGLVALSGAMVGQSQGYADVQMGTGTIVVGLASVIIGEVIFGVRHSFGYRLFSVVCGSVIYRIIIAVVLQMGLKTTDLKLLTAVIVAIALSIPVFSQKFAAVQNRR